MSTLTTINNWDTWLVAREAINDNFTALNTDKLEAGDLLALAFLNTVGTDEIRDEAVTNPKLAHMATKTYKGRTAWGTWDPEDVPVATLKTDLSLVKWDVGLGNVDNTSDANKPISTATQAALDAKADALGADDNYVTDAEKAKLANISVTQAVDLDQMETDIAALANGMVYKGDWDASAWSFPGAGAAQAWRFYYVSVAGTVDWVAFAIGDNLVATVDNASNTTYAANWSKHDQTDAVQSVNGEVGAVVLDADDIDDTSTVQKFTSAWDIAKLAGIEALADVTDAANVAAAWAVMESDTSTASMWFVIDEDNMASDSNTKVPTQQSVKAYVDAEIAGVSGWSWLTQPQVMARAFWWC